LIGSDLEKEAIEKVDGVVLGSVFTHLLIEDFYMVMYKFIPIIERGGIVSFSVFLEDEYRHENHSNVYGVENCYSRVFYTREQMESWCNWSNDKWNCGVNRNYTLKEHGSFLAQGQHLHKYFTISL